ncbi:substrate-binding periplasmic protein [Andreprevotia chitinilytica]|uniref:substrate-binding periplasmic protein n=1 Tax=Andreprevotia chitinilytica TaxID=396808 RepID=UPI00068BC660|nr:transporter substrate-binding domain-containing protein [Andreprevotia chitinilytica]
MTSKLFCIGIGVWVALLATTSRAADVLTLVTEDYPPFNISLDNGKGVGGVSTDIVRALLARANVQGDIHVYPWVRALQMARDEVNTCVYSTNRTPEREALYKWVGPMIDDEQVLYARADEPVRVKQLEDARSARIGSYNGAAMSTYLRGLGFKVEDAPQERLNPHKLAAGRIDYWVTGVLTGQYLASKEGVTHIKPVLTVRKNEMFIACNLGVADTLIGRLNSVLAAMRKDGTLGRIQQTFFATNGH